MHDPKPIILLGSNAALAILQEHCEDRGVEIHGIIDSDYYNNTACLEGIPVIGDEDYLKDNLCKLRKDFLFFLAVNWMPMPDAVTVRNRQKRHRWIDQIKELSLPCTNIVSDTAKISKSAKIGQNVFIGHFVVVEPRAVLADFSSVWDLGIVGHDCTIGENSTLQRGVCLSGNITVGQNAYLAPFCKVLNSVTVANESQLQPGIVLLRDTRPGEVVSTDRGNLRRIRAVDQ
jgi:acetyltransferase-like isoleucine patch superfamily enzyme